MAWPATDPIPPTLPQTRRVYQLSHSGRFIPWSAMGTGGGPTKHWVKVNGVLKPVR